MVERRTREKREKKNTKKASQYVKNDESGTKDPWKSRTKAYRNDEGTEKIYRTTKKKMPRTELWKRKIAMLIWR